MKLVFTEHKSHPHMRLGVQFSDWERPAVNGNSLGMFVFVYSDKEKPNLQEIFLRNEGKCIGRMKTLPDSVTQLASLCPGWEHQAVFGHLCINRLVLRREGWIAVIVTDESGARHHLGTIAFFDNQCDEGLSRLSMGLRPILITSLGRSGSTVLANSLGQHPEVAQIGDYPFEYRFFSYCLDATYVLTSPANHDFSMEGDAFENRESFKIGFNPFNHREYDRLIGNDSLRTFYEGKFAGESAQFFMARAKEAIALAAANKKRAVAFVEKMAGIHLANLAENLCSDLREIVLVREFWSMALSMIAFDGKRGTASFFAGNPDAWLIAMAFQYSFLLQRSKLDGKILVDYDELMRAPRARLTILARELELSTDDEALEAMLVPFAANNKYRAAHSTDPKSKQEYRRLFSDAAIEAVEHFLMPRIDGGTAIFSTWRGEMDNSLRQFGMNGADRTLIRGDSPNLPATWVEALGVAVRQETLQFQLDREMVQEELQKVRNAAELNIAGHIDHATRAEAYSQSLLDEIAKLKTALEKEQAARETQRLDALRQIEAQTERADRAETYNQSLLTQLDDLRGAVAKQGANSGKPIAPLPSIGNEE